MSAYAGTVCDSLAAISKVCAQHALGLSSTIEIIESGDVTTVPAPDTGKWTISTDVTLDDTKVFYQWRLGKTQAEFSYASIGQKGNQTYRNTLTVYVPLQRDATEEIFNSMINGEFLIRFGDVNGNKRLFGNDDAPAMIPEGGIQGLVNEEQNGVTITFEYVGPTPYFYTGAAPLT
jgi:hypothetical protein